MDKVRILGARRSTQGREQRTTATLGPIGPRRPHSKGCCSFFCGPVAEIDPYSAPMAIQNEVSSDPLAPKVAQIASKKSFQKKLENMMKKREKKVQYQAWTDIATVLPWNAERKKYFFFKLTTKKILFFLWWNTIYIGLYIDRNHNIHVCVYRDTFDKYRKV